MQYQIEFASQKRFREESGGDIFPMTSLRDLFGASTISVKVLQLPLE